MWYLCCMFIFFHLKKKYSVTYNGWCKQPLPGLYNILSVFVVASGCIKIPFPNDTMKKYENECV